LPTVEASFPDGYDQLKAYLKKNAIDKLNDKIDPKDLELVTYTFYPEFPPGKLLR